MKVEIPASLRCKMHPHYRAKGPPKHPWCLACRDGWEQMEHARRLLNNALVIARMYDVPIGEAIRMIGNGMIDKARDAEDRAAKARRRGLQLVELANGQELARQLAGGCVDATLLTSGDGGESEE